MALQDPDKVCIAGGEGDDANGYNIVYFVYRRRRA